MPTTAMHILVAPRDDARLRAAQEFVTTGEHEVGTLLEVLRDRRLGVG